MAGKKQGELSFEGALDRLEEIVDQIEQEELELDESLALFEEGVRMLRAAEAKLSAADARIEQLFESGDGFRLEELAAER
jgi:exodeoxyribonuclease VII small subunit